MLHDRWKLVPVVLVACLAVLGNLSLLMAQEHPKPVPVHVENAGAADHHGAADADREAYSIKSDLPFWSAIAFIGFVLAVKGLGLWDLLISSMADREKAESEAISTAESDLKEAHAALRKSKGRLEALDEQIRETMAEAHRDAQSTRDEIFRAANKDAKSAVDRATYEINRVRDQSLNDIFETLATRVADATEGRLRNGLHAEDHERLIDSVLGDLAIH